MSNTGSGPILSGIASLGRGLAGLLFPSRCVGCGARGGLLCQPCVDKAPRVMPPICLKCGRPLVHEGPRSSLPGRRLCGSCEEIPLRMEGVRSAYLLTGVMRRAVHDFKYRGVFSLAPVLGHLLAEHIRENPTAADVVVPVPLHKRRLKERGYDQAALLAECLAREASLVLREDWLVRVRPTVPQVRTTSAEERRKNVVGAFVAGKRVEGVRSVLLIDDVCTTGATLEACALALKEAGVERVRGLTLAREA